MNDGRVKCVRERGKTDYDSAGKPIRSVGTVQDITTMSRSSAVCWDRCEKKTCC